jgi:hypothetical protein
MTTTQWGIVLGWPLLVAGFGLWLISVQPARAQSDVVYAQSFVLMDGSGMIRAQLSMRGDDQPQLIMFNKLGEKRLVVGLAADPGDMYESRAALTFYDVMGGRAVDTLDLREREGLCIRTLFSGHHFP